MESPRLAPSPPAPVIVTPAAKNRPAGRGMPVSEIGRFVGAEKV